MISIFPSWILHSYAATFQLHLHNGVYISQLIGYSRTCGSSQHSLYRGLLVTRKLLNQGFLLVKLKSLLRKLCGRHHDLVDRYGISVLQMTGVTSGAGTAYPSGAPEFTPVLVGFVFTRSLVLYVFFAERCLSFFTFSFGHSVVCSSSKIRILFIPLVSSNSSWYVLECFLWIYKLLTWIFQALQEAVPTMRKVMVKRERR